MRVRLPVIHDSQNAIIDRRYRGDIKRLGQLRWDRVFRLVFARGTFFRTGGVKNRCCGALRVARVALTLPTRLRRHGALLERWEGVRN